MVAYSFQKRFAVPILAGTKRQTIRGARKRHARIGEQLQLFTGMRTKQCERIGSARCHDVQPLTLYFLKAGRVCVDGVDYKRHDLFHFARADGFKDWDDMRDFWKGAHPGLDTWDGFLIRWEAFEPTAAFAFA